MWCKAVPIQRLNTHPGLGLLFFSSFLLLPHQLISPTAPVGNQLTTQQQSLVACDRMLDLVPIYRLASGCKLPRTARISGSSSWLYDGSHQSVSGIGRNQHGMELVYRRRGCNATTATMATTPPSEAIK